MASENSTSRPSKRRKTKASPNSILIGGKAFSLEGYLAAPAAKPVAEPATNLAGTKLAGAGPNAEISEEPASAKPTLKTNGRIPNFEKRSQGHDTPPKFRSREDRGLLKTRKQLPIWQHREEIQRALSNKDSDSDVLVLVGETGSGKSTQVPQFLYQEAWCRRQMVKVSDDEVFVGGMIAITQPRRVAATTLAHRVSQEAGTPLGKGPPHGLVGYSVRFDHVVPKGTKIKFLTEGMLLQELLRDPNLRNYSAVVVDEIHERSLDVDLLVGFLKQILAGDKSGRGGVPLKVIIMSATADVDVIQEFFKDLKPDQKDASPVQVLRIKGRQYPVELHHEPRPVPDLQDALVKSIFKIHTQEQLPGDILAFLTGQEEIESAQRLIEEYAETLASNVPKIKVFPLYGQLSLEAQRDAFQPVKGSFTRKIVLATNIAETSVTVPGGRYVVDGGKAKGRQ